ncbi:NAD-dependent epimerase/dehydratase family protein [Kitasatospora sp. NPDC057223]|uniref:NAD-dependent epimerase/dehydratase family protein n=1 Tax=Kitasatospora sp. NPDC057223 TaxID=3346055 RepID=UPI0036317E51
MRVLVLGGTVFLSHAVAAEAVRRGHEVVCAARGSSGRVPDGARLVKVDRNEPDSVQVLAGERFDAVVDVATMSHRWVLDALRAVGAQAGHWTFVSSINVYADAVTAGQDETAALHEPIAEEAPPEERIQHPYLYGAIKAASEQAVLEQLGERAFVVRSGLIVGPGDVSDRFGYWPARISRGGRVAVPDAAGQITQWLDVRDLAHWIVDAGEQRLGGVFNGVGTAHRLGDFFGRVVGTVGAPDTELVPVPVPVLTAEQVEYWRGPKSMPLWMPDEDSGFCAHDNGRALAAGLRPRPAEQTLRDVLADERRLGLDRERKAGLTDAEETELLKALEVWS